MLFIPEKLKIGFQKREDTFDGKLSYIIYYDEKGKLRKEKSWNDWCDSSISYLEIQNKPFKHPALNKSVQRDSYHFGSGRNMLRIYDPRGFEYEITTDNLLGIMNYNDVIKNELQGEYIYAFDSGNLFLIPVNSEQYKEAIKMTESVKTKIRRKDLVPGNTYLTRNGHRCIYIGKYNINKKIDEKEKYYFYCNLLFCSTGPKDIFFIKEADGGEEYYKDININTLGTMEGQISNEHLQELILNYIGSIQEKKVKGIYFSEKIEINTDVDRKSKILGKKINDSTFIFIEYSPFGIHEYLRYDYKTQCAIHKGEYNLSQIFFHQKTVEHENYTDYNSEYDFIDSNNDYSIPTNSALYKRITELRKHNIYTSKKEAEEAIDGIEKSLFAEWNRQGFGNIYIEYEDGSKKQIVNRR